MNHFLKILRYVWPQWHRLAAIVFSVCLISVLFVLSIATIAPILTVMMGSDGIHGWVDRKISHQRYDVKFYTPDSADLASPESNAAFRIKLTDIDKESVFSKAGLQREDFIVYVGEADTEMTEKSYRSKMLETLATSDKNQSILIGYNRINENNVIEFNRTSIDTPAKPFYADTLQNIIKPIPREQNKETKLKAIILIISLMAGVTIIRCLARFIQNYLAEKVVNISLSNLRKDMFSHIVNMKIGFFTSQGSSDTVSRLIRDSETAGQGIKVLLGKVIREISKAIGLFVFALYLAPQLTIIFLISAPLTLGAVAQLGRKISKATKKSLQSWSVMLAKLEEFARAIKIVKVYNRQQHERESYDSLNKRLLKQLLRIAKVNAATGPIMEVLGMLAASAGLIFGAHWVFSGQMDQADFFTLLTTLSVLAESIRKCSNVWNKIKQSNAGAKRVFSVLEYETEKEKADAIELGTISEGIELKNVCFSYPGTDIQVLNNIDLTIKAGSKIALVGPNGCGKSTIVSLLPRFFDPDIGVVLFDDNDIRDCTLESLRDRMSMVTQQVVTFNDTVANNIGYGKIDATREEIVAAAKRAFAHEFIEPLADGYDSMIGEDSSGFSGGQLQRICIARAILKDPDILIFDEATSQVDADSEAKIHTAIEKFMESRTSIIIAHRFSTILKADSIVVVNQGRIEAIGTHEELRDSCGLYNSLYETQLIKG